MVLLSIPQALQHGGSCRADTWPGTCSCGSRALAVTPCLSQGMAAVTGSMSRCSPAPPQPQHLPKSFYQLTRVLLRHQRVPTSHVSLHKHPQSLSSPFVHPCVFHTGLVLPFPGNFLLEHGRDSPSLPSPYPPRWGCHRGCRALTITFAQVGILKQHLPFPLSHLILKGITARLPIWEIQNRALFMPDSSTRLPLSASLIIQYK